MMMKHLMQAIDISPAEERTTSIACIYIADERNTNLNEVDDNFVESEYMT